MGLHDDCGERFVCVCVEHLTTRGRRSTALTVSLSRRRRSGIAITRAMFAGKASAPSVAPGHSEVSMLQVAGV
jgi:hypothetical protein